MRGIAGDQGELQTEGLLQFIADAIGRGVAGIDFSVNGEAGLSLSRADFALDCIETAAGGFVFQGPLRERANKGAAGGDVSIAWSFTPSAGGFDVALSIEKCAEIRVVSCDNIVLHFASESGIGNWRLLQRSSDYVFNPIGFPRVSEMIENPKSCRVVCGVFPNHTDVGLFLGTMIPQDNLHDYHYSRAETEGTGETLCLRFISRTSFLKSHATLRVLSTETTWVCASMKASEAMDTYGAFVPINPRLEPAIGWNSWDYYYFSVTLDEMVENMEAIGRDDVLLAKVKYVVVDEGWEHMNGEWEPNYKFPGGLEKLVDETVKRGFLPGIWTASTLVNKMSAVAWRKSHMLLKNEFGDPLSGDFSDHYILDPTHPDAQAFLREVYTRLYNIGFRLFKVDYVSTLLYAERFHDNDKAPYQVLRDFFTLIRECVHDDSYIIGCSLPSETGPGVVDSGRTGIDIHNQWEHFKWCTECYTYKYIYNNRVWANDIDFLVVRGKDTSLEEITTVDNPSQNNPSPSRWRRGPVFNFTEARSWASMVILSGGSIFSSDKVSMLNEEGMELTHRVMQADIIPTRPVDLCSAYHASVWYGKGTTKSRLGIVNFEDTSRAISLDFQSYDIDSPFEVTDFWTGETLIISDGRLAKSLEAHECLLVEW